MAAPPDALTHDILTHLATADRPIAGRTSKELLVLAGGVLALIGALRQPHVAQGVRLGEGVLALGLALLLVFVRPQGRSLLAWGRAALAYAAGPRVLIWVPAPERRRALGGDDLSRRPPHLAGLTGHTATGGGTTPPAPRSHGRPATQALPFVPVRIDADVVTFGDGRHCAVLQCSGAHTALMDAAALRGLDAAYHSFLVGLPFPLQLLVDASPVDLRRYSAAREARLGRASLALRRLDSADIAFMHRAARRLGALDHHLFVVVPAADPLATPAPMTPLAALRSRRMAGLGAPSDDEVQQLLRERCERVVQALGAAHVHAWRLGATDLWELWYRLLCPRSALVQPLDPGHADPIACPTIVFHHREGDSHA